MMIVKAPLVSDNTNPLTTDGINYKGNSVEIVKKSNDKVRLSCIKCGDKGAHLKFKTKEAAKAFVTDFVRLKSGSQ